MRAFIERYPVLVFVCTALAIQFSIVGFVFLTVPEGAEVNSVPLAHSVFRLRVFVPIILVTLLTYYLEDIKGVKKLYGSFFHWRVSAKWYAFAFSWKFIMGYAAIILAYFFYDAPLDWWIGDNLNGLINHIPFIIGIALVEETTWIRFSMTRMQMRYSAFWSAMIVGNCWAAWYLPMNLIDIGTPPIVPDIVFHSGVVSLMVLLIWVYNTTRSGTVLLFMQIMSNTVFFLIPVLPDDVVPIGRILAYAWIFVFIAVVIILVYGPENLSRRKRMRWDEDQEPYPASNEQEATVGDLQPLIFGGATDRSPNVHTRGYRGKGRSRKSPPENEHPS